MPVSYGYHWTVSTLNLWTYRLDLKKNRNKTWTVTKSDKYPHRNRYMHIVCPILFCYIQNINYDGVTVLLNVSNQKIMLSLVCKLLILWCSVALFSTVGACAHDKLFMEQQQINFDECSEWGHTCAFNSRPQHDWMVIEFGFFSVLVACVMKTKSNAGYFVCTHNTQCKTIETCLWESWE